MKRKKSLLTGATVLLLIYFGLLTIAGCKKTSAPPDDSKTKPTSLVLSYIKGLGYKDSQIQDLGTDYLVEGDILFSKDTTKKPCAKVSPGKTSQKQVDQYGDGTYVSPGVSVTVAVDPTMNAYLSFIQYAINQYNNTPSSLRFFLLGTPGAAATPNLTITTTNNPNLCGSSYAPSNGQPGAFVFINRNILDNESGNKKLAIIMHEMGHTIGLRHSNWVQNNEPQMGVDPVGTPVNAIQIPGTPTSGNDPNSIMIWDICMSTISTFSQYDIAAIQFLYPPVYGGIVYVRAEYSNVTQSVYDHYAPGTSYVDGSIWEWFVDVTIKTYSNAACTVLMTLQSPLAVQLSMSATYGGGYTTTITIPAGQNSLFIYSQVQYEVRIESSSQNEDNFFDYGAGGTNAFYIAKPSIRI